MPAREPGRHRGAVEDEKGHGCLSKGSLAESLQETT
jgi:hypothetical protein